MEWEALKRGSSCSQSPSVCLSFSTFHAAHWFPLLCLSVSPLNSSFLFADQDLPLSCTISLQTCSHLWKSETKGILWQTPASGHYLLSLRNLKRVAHIFCPPISLFSSPLESSQSGCCSPDWPQVLLCRGHSSKRHYIQGCALHSHLVWPCSCICHSC